MFFLSRSRRPTSAGVVMALIFVAMAGAGLMTFFPLIFSDQFPGAFAGIHDARCYHTPLAFFGDYWEYRGERPEWNGFVLCGMPYAGNPQALLFYPPNILRRWLMGDPTPFGVSTSLAVMVALHYLLGAWGAFMLARAHRLSRPASLVAAFVFTLNAGYVVRYLMHWVFALALAWLPWLWLALRASVLAKTLRRAMYFGVFAGLASGMSLLAGFPQLAFFGMLSGGLYYGILWAFRFRTLSGPNRSKSLLQPLAIVALIGLICASVSAALLLPGCDLTRHSGRMGEHLVDAEKWTGENPPMPLLDLLMVYPGSKAIEGVRLCGLGAWLLAAFSVFWSRRREVIACWAPFLLLICCAAAPDGLVARGVAALTPFGWSNPQRLATVACLPLGLLAGFGAEVCMTRAVSRRERIARGALTAFVAALGFGALLHFQIKCHPFPIGFSVAIAPLLLTFIVWASARRPLSFRWGWMLPALLFFETLAWNSVQIPHYLAEGLAGSLPKLSASLLPGAPSENAHKSLISAMNLFALTPTVGGYEPLHLSATRVLLSAPGEESTYRRVAGTQQAAAQNDYYNLFLKRRFWLARQYAEGPLPSKSVLFPSASTAFVQGAPPTTIPKVDADKILGTALSSNVTRRNLPPPRIEKMGEDSAYCVTLPRLSRRHASLVVRYSATGAVTLHPLTAPEGNDWKPASPSRTVKRGTNQAIEFPLPDSMEGPFAIMLNYVEPDASFMMHEWYLLSDSEDENEHIRIVSQTANTIDVELVDLSGPRLLSFIDVDYPGWRAFVNGQPAPLLRVNDIFKGVEVPAGTSRIRFEFHSQLTSEGVAIARAGWVFALGALASPLASSTRRRRLWQWMGPSARTPKSGDGV